MHAARRSLVVVAAIACAALVAFAAPLSTTASTRGNSLPVGGLTLLTGQFASFGQGALQGLKAGIDQVNSAGGVLGQPFNLIVADSTSDPVDAVPAAVKLVNVNHVLFENGVAGPLADATVATFTRAKIPFLTPGGDVNFDHNTNPYVWRLTPSDSQLGVAMALYAHHKHYKRAALMFTNGSTATGLGDVVRRSFTALGGKIVSSVTLQPDLSSYQSEVARTLAAHPDVILVEMDAPTAGVVMHEMNSQNGLKVPLVGTDEDIGTDFLKAVGADLARKALVSLEGGTYQSPAAGIFTKAIKKVSHKTPIANAQYTYDGIVIAALAMNASHGVTSADLNRGMLKVSAPGGKKVYCYAQGVAALKAGKRITYVGASGPFYYNKYHNVFGPFIAVKVTANGTDYQTVATFSPTELAKATQ